MSTPRLSPTARGFTLVELLVAAMLGVLIAGATATSMAQLFRARAASAARQQAFGRAESAASRIALDVVAAVRDHDPTYQRLAVISGGNPRRERDEVMVVGRTLRPLRGIEGEPEGDEFEFQYRVMPGPESEDTLWRRADMAHDENQDGGGIATPIVAGILALSITGIDSGDTWIEEWDSDNDGLPHALRISVTAQSDDGRATATVRRIVAIDRVPLPPPATDTDTDSGSSGSTPTSPSGGGR